MEVSTAKRKQSSQLFRRYVRSLVWRSILFACGVYFFLCDRFQLTLDNLGPVGGFNFIDLASIAILVDFASKFSSRAKISIGSLKQYDYFQIPTKNTLGGNFDALLQRISDVVAQGRIKVDSWHSHPKENIEYRLEEARATLLNAKDDVVKELRHIAHDVDFMRALSFDESDLDTNSQARHLLRMRRLKEILPVAFFWILLNAVVAVIAIAMGWMSASFAALWVLFYFWFDMMCVVLWCPLQVFFMRNRCCATCQIFNWDAVMVATPMFFALNVVTGAFIVLSLIILLRWELKAFFCPERFAEETNASLSCTNCTEQLCYIRGKVGVYEKDDELEEALRA